jgi:tetratricopeptide (TPR) repeat protein
VFKENEMEHQRERLSSLREKDTALLQDRLGELTKKFEEEKRITEAALRRKDDDIRALTGRLAMRDKRLQEETRRRAKEIEGLKKQVSEEEASVRAHFAAESARLERLQKDQECALDRLLEKEKNATEQKTRTDESQRETLRQERQDLEQSLRVLEGERLELQRESQALLSERETKIQFLTESLDERERAMEELRDQSRRLADSLRKRMEVLRQAQRAGGRSGSNVGAWTAFEQGVRHYQQQAWTEAIRAFEQCLTRDPRWGAAYQYLALSYHAQGDNVRAAQVAERALREDPSNTELGNWIDRLRSSIQTQKKAS